MDAMKVAVVHKLMEFVWIWCHYRVTKLNGPWIAPKLMDMDANVPYQSWRAVLSDWFGRPPAPIMHIISYN
jgi:hypothetical protein